jgi:PAS domain S-box-containing protein
LNTFIRKSALISLSLGLLAGALLFSWSLLGDWSRVSEQVRAQNTQTLQLLLPTLIDLDTTHQTERLNATLTRLLERSSFQQVVLQRGTTSYYVAEQSQQNLTRPVLDMLTPKFITLSVSERSSIGDQAPMRLSATLNAHQAFDGFVNRHWQFARIGLLRTLLIILIVVLIFEFVAIRPLRALGQRVKGDGSELSLLPEGNPADAIEIKQLSRAFNERVESIFRLQFENQSLVAALRAAPDCCLIVNLESGNLLFCNDAAEALFGRTNAELRARPIWDLWHQDRQDFESDARAAQQMLGQFLKFILESERPDGSSVPIEVHMTTFNLDEQQRGLIFARNISERGALLRRVADNQKANAIRTLAGGLAHDLNNRIQIAAGHLDLIDPESLSQTDKTSLMTARQAILQSAKPIDQLLKYSEQKILDTAPVALALCLERHREAFLQAAAPCQLNLDIQDKTLTVETNEARLVASLVQLLNNASDATPSGQSAVSLTLVRCALSTPIAGAQQTIPAGRYASLIITDQGRGIAKADRSQIFDPFFSTKTLEQGGGMGLSVVVGFLQATATYLTLQSEQGQGTTFTLLLPEIETDPSVV